MNPRHRRLSTSVMDNTPLSPSSSFSPLPRVDSLTDVTLSALSPEELFRLEQIKQSIARRRRLAELESKSQSRCLCCNLSLQCRRYNLWLYFCIFAILLLFLFCVTVGGTQLRYDAFQRALAVQRCFDPEFDDVVKPVSYELKLGFVSDGGEGSESGDASSGTLRIDGVVRIEFVVREVETVLQSRCIVLDGYNLTIEKDDVRMSRVSAQKNEQKDVRVRVMKIETQMSVSEPGRQRIVVWVDSRDILNAGDRVWVEMKYGAAISTDLRGLYVSNYVGKDGVPRRVLSTQMECCSAKSVVPAVDLPLVKAKWMVAVELDSRVEGIFADDSVWGNGKLLGIDSTPVEGGEIKKWNFETTPPMSSYLLAVVIGNLLNVSNDVWDPLTEQVRTVSVLLGHDFDRSDAEFALRIASEVVLEFGDYFGISYFRNMSKLDLVGLADFEAGAMENWGLITFRSRYLAANQLDSFSHNVTVAGVIAHEIAHQWTGNLVTMCWWDELFLNEGFATFFEYFVLDRLHPRWAMWHRYYRDEFFPVLEFDALEYSRSLQAHVTTAEEINTKFDFISYNKGSAILRMISKLIGDDLFQKWMQRYLAENAFSCSTSEKLLDALVETLVNAGSSTEDAERFLEFKSWISQEGYPVVNVERVYGSEYVISQERFLAYDRDLAPGEIAPLWWIPIRMETSLQERMLLNLTDRSMKLSLPVSWFKLNIGEGGYYRVNYPRFMWTTFIDLLREADSLDEFLSLDDVLGLIDDAFSLGEAGYLEISVALELCVAVLQKGHPESEGEEDPFLSINVVLETISTHLRYMVATLLEFPVCPLLREYVRDLLSSLSSVVGYFPVTHSPSPDSDSYWSVRDSLLDLLAVVGRNRTIIEDVLKLLPQSEDDWSDLPSDNYYTLVRIFASFGSDEVMAILHDRFLDTLDPYFLRQMSYTSLSHRLVEILELTFSEHVRSQDGLYVIRETLRSRKHLGVVWNWIRENWDDLTLRYGKQTTEHVLVVAAGQAFASKVRQNDMLSFFGEVGVESSLIRIANGHVQRNRRFVEVNELDLKAWLEPRYQDTDS